MLRLRALSALVLVPVVAFFVYVGGWFFLAFIIGLALVGVYEIARMLRQANLAPNWLALGGLAVWPALGAYEPGWQMNQWALTAVLVGSLVWSTMRVRDPRSELYGWALSLAGALYVGWLLSYFVLLRQLPTGSSWQGFDSGVLWLALVFGGTWAADTGAYFTGRWLGSRKLYPSLSPNKTWEGALGGTIWATVVALALSPVLSISLLSAAAIGVALSLAAILGDLAESWLKRGFGVKDTGGLIPGHGGVLDRLDSLLFSAVAVYYLGPWLLGA